MTTIIAGMSPTELRDALNSNFTELATTWGVNQTSVAKSFVVFTTSNITPANICYNFRVLGFSYGQSGGSFIASLNTGFASTVQRFKDDFLHDICSPMTAYGEPTALVSDDGNRLDLWFTGTVLGVSNIYYTYSTDGQTFATPVKTDIPDGYKRSGVMKVGDTIYLFANYLDASIHCFSTSATDRIHYTDHGEKIGLGSAGAWDDKGLGNTFAWKEGSTYYLFYDGQKNAGDELWSTGLATASDPEGTWTKYGSNPVFTTASKDVEGAEMLRVNNEIIKRDGLYYAYLNSSVVVPPHDGSFYDIKRLNSSDLYTWTDEGSVLNVLHLEAGYISYADVAFCQFKGKSYMFNNPSNQVDAAYIDVAIDNRTLAELLALKP